MSILQSQGSELVGAVALLQHADPTERARFTALEDAVWSNTTLRPAVIESVRLRCILFIGTAQRAGGGRGSGE